MENTIVSVPCMHVCHPQATATIKTTALSTLTTPVLHHYTVLCYYTQYVLMDYACSKLTVIMPEGNKLMQV